MSYETISVTQPGFTVAASGGLSSLSALPMISVAGFSRDAAASQRLAARTGDALMLYIDDTQASANVPSAERVELQPVKRALNNPAVRCKGRTKALPIVVFLTVATR